jgi:hypothetical protein
MTDDDIKPSPMMPAPLCVPCGKTTLPSRVMPRDEGEELHIFEFPTCAQSQTLVVKLE